MAMLDKQSVREQAQRIKLEFERLACHNKMDNDSKLLFNSMLMLINLLIAIFLEKTTKKTKKNSSKPPSQSQNDESALTVTGSQSKGQSETNGTAANTGIA